MQIHGKRTKGEKGEFVLQIKVLVWEYDVDISTIIFHFLRVVEVVVNSRL